MASLEGLGDGVERIYRLSPLHRYHLQLNCRLVAVTCYLPRLKVTVFCVLPEISDHPMRSRKMTSRTLIMTQNLLFKLKNQRRKEEEVICLSAI